MRISDNLIFIGNELLNPNLRKELKIPLKFISYAYVKGKLYNHLRNDGTFVLQNEGKTWGNDVVYGAIFLLKDADFYMRILDSYHQCSKSLLKKNHSKDIHHRIRGFATLISFDTLDELSRLKYLERDSIDVSMYVGNKNHPKINQRLNKTVSYRITNGVDKHFTKLFREENKHE